MTSAGKRNQRNSRCQLSRDGVWATPPFMHNGSVPNLYEMLIPAKEHVGTKNDLIGIELPIGIANALDINRQARHHGGDIHVCSAQPKVFLTLDLCVVGRSMTVVAPVTSAFLPA
jgi:hypothetical protein